MTLREIRLMVLDSLGYQEGDRRNTSLINSSINTAYINICKKLGEITTSLVTPITRIMSLPTDCLQVLSIEHSTFGKIPSNLYKVSSNNIILSNTFDLSETTQSMTFVYIKKPDILADDTSKPIISDDYHMALYFYSMFVMSGNKTFYDNYLMMLNSIQDNDFDNETYYTSFNTVVDVLDKVDEIAYEY